MLHLFTLSDQLFGLFYVHVSSVTWRISLLETDQSATLLQNCYHCDVMIDTNSSLVPPLFKQETGFVSFRADFFKQAT